MPNAECRTPSSGRRSGSRLICRGPCSSVMLVFTQPPVPESIVHPAEAASPRVRAGVARNLAAVPELFADRALAGDPERPRDRGAAARHPPREDARADPRRPPDRHPGRRGHRRDEDAKAARLARVPRDQLRLGGARPRPAGHPLEHAVLRRRRDQARARARRSSRTGAGGRWPTGSWKRCRRACGAPTTAASSTTTSARARSATSTPATRRCSRKGFDGIRRTPRARRARGLPGDGAGRGRAARVPGVGHPGVRRRRWRSPAVTRPSLRGLAAAETGRRAPRRAARAWPTVCERVPAAPARSFHEALQSMWFTHLVLNLETDGHAFGPGRFDQYLYPHYRALDRVRRADRRTQAQELLDLMWVKFDEITLAKDSGEAQTSSSYPEFQNLNIGGLTRDGRDATNELSLHVPHRARAHEAAAAGPVGPDQLEDLVARSCCGAASCCASASACRRCSTATRSCSGMVNRGKTLEDARASSLNGCVACFCDGKDRMASSGYFNLAKCLELALNDGRDRLTGERLGPATGDPRAFASFDDVLARVPRAGGALRGREGPLRRHRPPGLRRRTARCRSPRR